MARQRPSAAILVTVGWYVLLVVGTALLTRSLWHAAANRWRGVEPGPSPVVHRHGASRWGTTVALHQYTSDGALARALDQLAGLGVTWLRQPLPWAGIEPRPGVYAWEPWDRLVRAATARGFRLILVLDTSPAWAREEPDNPFAPPRRAEDLAAFAAAAARRYGPLVDAYQIWDEPNVRPHWGDALADPAGYAELLRAVAPAIRAVDPGALILTAGLAPNGEPGGFNMSDVRYLRGLYAASASPYFDVVAFKAYGFWSGPDDRRYGEEVLNWSRAVLVREVMEAAGDGATPVWFVEGGWATLPEGWSGAPPPWGSDRPEVQVARLKAAVARARQEWPWVGVMALQLYQPDAPSDDPRWGLALVDPSGRLTPLGRAWGEIVRADGLAAPPPGGPPLWAWWGGVGLAAALTAAAGARLLWVARRLPWANWQKVYSSLPEWAQVVTFAAWLALFSLAPGHLALSGLLYLGVLWFAHARPDLALAGVLVTLPFFLWTKPFGRLSFSLPELLTLAALAGYGLRWARPWAEAVRREPWPAARALARELWGHARRVDALDLSVVVLVVWSGLSVFWAHVFGVASREFRVVILEPALFYWMVRHGGITRRQMRLLAYGLLVGGVLVSAYALWQWGTGEAVLAEGVRRARGPYGSPNNLALYLGRVVPVALAFATATPAREHGRPAWSFWGALVLTGSALFLTFSRGAWLLGVPAALFCLALLQGPRARRVAGALALVGLLGLLPFAGTERVRTLFDLSEGTWYMRRLLWAASLNMARDFWFLGVGLDNFLYVYPLYRFRAAWREPDLSHPHNIVLHFWLALGLVGLLLLVWQQWAFWRAVRRAQAQVRRAFERALLAGAAAMMVNTLAHGLVDNSFFLVDLAFLWMFALGTVGWLTARRARMSGATSPSRP